MRGRPWIGALGLLGALVTGSAVWHVAVFDAHATGAFHGAIALVMIGGAGLGLLYGAYWHARYAVSPERYPWVAAWMGGGAVLFGSVGTIVLYSGSRRVLPAELFEALHIAGSVGLAAGLFVGTLQLRVIRNAEIAARAEAEAEALQAERERLDRLNGLLRHYVLNAMNVILGYADRLRGTVPDAEHDRLATIEERAETVVMLIEHVRSVTGVVEGATETAAVDPERAVAAAIADVEPRPSVSVAAEDAPPVRANDLEGALSLLLDALAASTADGGSLAVEVHPDAEHVRVTITASGIDRREGPGDDPFDRSGPGTSLQFHLAKAIVEEYGAVCLLERTDDRLAFELVLDRAGAQRAE